MQLIRFFVVLCLAAVRADDPWWRTASLYEIYIRSFKDSNGDGVGDIKGIIEKLQYLKELGVDAIWITPFYASPMVDLGYDISDFTAVDPVFGTMADYDVLQAKCKEMGVKIVVDFVPNHTSDKHIWFQISKDPEHPLFKYYKDFYVWKDPIGFTSDGKPIPPNNWLCLFGGSPWKWNDKRKQFFLHHFTVEQPDLNFRDPNVVSNMTDVIDFWINKGIDGMRVDAVDHIYEHIDFPDEEPRDGVGADYTWFEVNHTAMINQPETFQLLDKWADHIYQRGIEHGKHIAMFLEVYATLDMTMKYYGTGKRNLKIPFNFFPYLKLSRFSTAQDIKTMIDQWMQKMPDDGVSSWVASNHDINRIPNSYGPEMHDTILLLMGVLPGVQVSYNGDEIGMENTAISWEQVVDPWAKSRGRQTYTGRTRDVSRTPIQWDSSCNAGFSSSSKTWLPINQNYWTVNVASQQAAQTSHLKVFQAIVNARKNIVFKKGTVSVLVPNKDTLIVVRKFNNSFYALISNVGDVCSTLTSKNLLEGLRLDTDMSVVVASVHAGISSETKFKKGGFSVTLRPKASILLKSSSSSSLYPSVFLLISSFLYFVKSSL